MKQNSSEIPARTDDVALNKTIERAKKELEHMIDLNPQVMLLVDHTGKIVRANKALLELLKFQDFKKILNRNLSDLFPCEEKKFFEYLLQNKGGYEVREIKIISAPGQHRLIRFAVISSDNDVSVVIVNDITSEKERASHQERKYKKEAVKALMGGLMHNINQPLTVIMVQAQFIQLALEKGLSRPEDLKKELQNIMALTMQIADMLKMVENPKDFVVQPYLEGVSILDIKRSGEQSKTPESFGPLALERIMSSLDVHDPGALLHARQTSACAGIIASCMGLGEKEVKTVERCAYFHDIGKIGIPDRLLQKPEALTENEMTVMKTHSEIGHNLLASFPLLRAEAEIALVHHERCDGKGYPHGLKKKDIPLFARILAVADAFDALLCSRSYRPAMPLETVISRIVQGSGTQFDPAVVEVLKKHSHRLAGKP